MTCRPGTSSINKLKLWLAAGCLTALVDDLRLLLREAKERNRQPSAAIFDCRTLQSTPESGSRAGYDGAKRRKGNKIHVAVDTLGNLLSLLVTLANEQDRAQVGKLAQAVQVVTGKSVEIAYVDQGYTGDVPAESAKPRGIQLEVIKRPLAKRGFVLLPRRWVVNAPSLGPHATDGWCAIMSGFPRRWRVFIWSFSPVSCFINGFRFKSQRTVRMASTTASGASKGTK